MVLRRRRPLLRGALLAGAGTAVYHAGKRSQANAQHEGDQDQQIADVSQDQQDEVGSAAQRGSSLSWSFSTRPPSEPDVPVSEHPALQ